MVVFFEKSLNFPVLNGWSYVISTIFSYDSHDLVRHPTECCCHFNERGIAMILFFFPNYLGPLSGPFFLRHFSLQVKQRPLRNQPTDWHVDEIIIVLKQPGDSKCPFHPLVGGHLTLERVTWTHHPKKVTLNHQECFFFPFTTIHLMVNKRTLREVGPGGSWFSTDFTSPKD